VDFGGTWIRAAAIGPSGECSPGIRKPTERQRPFELILEDLVQTIIKAADGKPEAVAIGVPTVIDKQGRLVPCVNLPTMSPIALSSYLENVFKVPVRTFNDASCFAAGEWWMGAGRGTMNFIGITLGTGIGMGIVFNGLLYTGRHGYAGEIWKTPWPSGRREEKVCGRSLELNYYAKTQRQLSGSEIAQAARQGDNAAIDVFKEYGRS